MKEHLLKDGEKWSEAHLEVSNWQLAVSRGTDCGAKLTVCGPTNS